VASATPSVLSLTVTPKSPEFIAVVPTIYFALASPDGYTLRNSFRIPDVSKPSWPHPVICDGKMYIREQNALLCCTVK
jgi:hypothetical protein